MEANFGVKNAKAMSIEEENMLRLPEWVWLKGGVTDKRHPTLSKRTVLMHTPTHTVLEFIRATITYVEDSDEARELFSCQFKYTDSNGRKENHCVFILRTSFDYYEEQERMAEIVASGIRWYKRQRNAESDYESAHLLHTLTKEINRN